MYSMGSQVHWFPCCDMDAIVAFRQPLGKCALDIYSKPLQAGRDSFMHSASQLCSQDSILLLLSLWPHLFVQLVSMPVIQHAESNWYS